MPIRPPSGPALPFVAALLALLAIEPAHGQIPAPPGSIPGFPAVFGAAETPSANLGAFRRWTGAIERSLHEWIGYDDPCATRFAGRCNSGEWRQLVARLADRPRREKIDRVNAFFNRMPYAVDASTWGIADYWATPFQFLGRSGDCEDYAIAKFVTLRQLGLASEEMRIVVVDDLNLRAAHAVLVVADGERLLVLDNQVPDVVESRRILHYRPVFSLNETHWWVHRKP
jgi:predicted transglutaminase-like cysteine proteinase